MRTVSGIAMLTIGTANVMYGAGTDTPGWAVIGVCLWLLGVANVVSVTMEMR